MPGFLYFLPGREPGQCKLDQIRQLGLGYAFEGPPAPVLVMNGPDGARGTIISTKTVADESGFGYYADRQTWQKIPPGSPGHDAGVWMGFHHGAKLSPADLARRQQLSGHWVELADCNQWLCPIARRVRDAEEQMTWYNALPQTLALTAAGEWSAEQVLPRFAPLWQVALDWFDAISGADTTGDQAIVVFRNTIDAAALALSANYRIERAEAAALGLLTYENAKTILNALIDLPTIDAWIKKKGLAAAG
jgi:hypothetical protein